MRHVIDLNFNVVDEWIPGLMSDFRPVMFSSFVNEDLIGFVVFFCCLETNGW